MAARAARRTRPATPLWVKLLLVAIAVGAPAWWLVDRHDRLANEARLSRIASAIAERPVRARCPGPIGRLSKWDTVEGSVEFDAAGRPADVTHLRPVSCAALDALAEGRSASALACVERSASCGDEAQAVARAVDVLAHEAWHLHGVIDEAETECRSLQTMAWAAQQLGASGRQAAALAQLQLETGYPLMPERYRSGGCRDGGPMDRRPDDPRWP